MEECNHIWEPTDSDEHGDPLFRPNRHMWSGLKAHVVCTECNVRTWMTKEEWRAIPASD